MASNIPYLTDLWSPVTGCTPCSPACANCWAAATVKRFPRAHDGGCNSGESCPETAKPFSEIVYHPDRLQEPLRWRKPRVSGVSFMGDLWHEQVKLPFIARVFDVMALAETHTFLLLTKRLARAMAFLAQTSYARARKHVDAGLWPPPNVWLGVTAWDDESYRRNVGLLRQTPAAHRWVSLEPLLGEIGDPDLTGIDWVVVGAESGPKRRPMPHEWAQAIGAEARAEGVPCYLKQQSANADGSGKLVHYAPTNRDVPREIAEVLRG